MEETHYYSFGLTMSGISSKALAFGDPKNKKGYAGNELQNKEFNDGSGLELYDFNARTYDQQIGRFIQIDPFNDEGGQESWSPYHYSYNNPVTYSDPDGKIPIPLIIIGLKFLVGAAVEYGSQVYDNYQSGKTGANAWKPKSRGDVGKIVLNGLTSTVDPSGGVVKKLAINTASNVVESVGGQIFEGNGILLQKTVTDVTVNTLSANIKIDGSKTVNSLDKKADRLERVARNNPSKRNGVQAAEARQAANKANNLNEATGTATTESAEAAGQKKTDKVKFNFNNDGGNTPMPLKNGQFVDNVGTRPIIFR